MQWGDDRSPYDRRGRYGMWLLSVLSLGASAAGLLWTVWNYRGAGADMGARAGVLGFGVSTLGLIVGAVSLRVSWQGYLADRREHAEGLPLSEIVDEFAVAVRTQWEAEARVRRLNDPYPLPVSWQAAAEELVEPWSLLLRLAAGGTTDAAALPPSWATGPHDLAGSGAEIVPVFADRTPGRRLVVLGEPGSGKTMLLVRLLLGVMDRRTAGDPVPVVFPLASWDPVRQDLDAWMEARLATDYPGLAEPAPTRHGAHTTRARALLDQRLVLPLLDGLDELPERLRGVALDAVNHTLPPGHPLVLTSRLAEYRAALAPATGVPVRLTAAAGIVLRPLDEEEAGAYLYRDAGGEGTASAARWAPVLARLGTASPVGLALRTPLMLFLARTVYNPRPGEDMGALPDPAELCDTERFADEGALRRHLFDAFVPAAYRRHPGRPCRWSAQEAERALAFLARHLERDRGGSVDLAWWGLRRAVPGRALTAMTAGAVGLRLLGLTFVGWLGLGLGVLPASSLAFVFVWWTASMDLAAVFAPHLPDGLILLHLLGSALVLHFLLGVALVAVSGVRSRPEPTRRPRWRWKPWTVVTGLFVGTALGIPISLVFGPTGGLGWGTAATLLVWITGSWTADPADLTTAAGPADIMATDRRTFRLFLLTGVIGCGLVLGPVIGLVLGYSEATTRQNVTTLLEQLLDGGLSGLGLGLWTGAALGLATAYTRTAWGPYTLALRRLSRRHGLPRDLMAFLQDAHENRGVLRQVGSVHQFRHIELQRRLARTPDGVTPGVPDPQTPG